MTAAACLDEPSASSWLALETSPEAVPTSSATSVKPLIALLIGLVIDLTSKTDNPQKNSSAEKMIPDIILRAVAFSAAMELSPEQTGYPQLPECLHRFH